MMMMITITLIMTMNFFIVKSKNYQNNVNQNIYIYDIKEKKYNVKEIIKSVSIIILRLDALNAFELGQDLSQRNGYLPQVPTGAEILRGAGYYTSHSGKMSNRWNMDEGL